MRYSHIVPAVLRETRIDAPILGHKIPKGTHLWLFSSGPSFMQPALNIDEKMRSDSSRSAKDRIGTWDSANVARFVPDRWLRAEKSEDENGNAIERLVFDPNAGPQMAFSYGPRACFGRKLAYIELRIVVTLLLWRFEFLQMEGELNSLDAVDFFMLRPKKCYVKLKPIDH